MGVKREGTLVMIKFVNVMDTHINSSLFILMWAYNPIIVLTSAPKLNCQ